MTPIPPPGAAPPDGASRVPTASAACWTAIPPGVACTANAVAWHAVRTPRGLAVLDQGRAVTWRQLADDLAHCVGFLDSSGIRSGMLVGIEVGPQRYRDLLLFLACEVIGAITTAFAWPDLTREDPVLPDCHRLVLNAAPQAQPEQDVLVPPADLVAQWTAAAPAEAVARLRVPPDPDGIVRISRTSGSTGRPKAVPITYAVQQRILAQRVAYVTNEVRANPRLLCLYTLGIRAVYTRVYAALQAGGTVLLPLAEQSRALLGSGAVNWVVCVVGEAGAIVRGTPRPPPGGHLLFEMVGARVSRPLRALVRERLGAVVQSTYSSNETNTVTFTDDDNVGTLVDGAEARVVDPRGKVLPQGRTGLVQVKTATMTSGYWNDPDLTASAFIDGWYHTHDAGFIPEHGKLVVLGRTDDMLNVGGVKLPPGPIEDEIRRLPGVRDAALLTQTEDPAEARLVVAVELAAPGLPEGLRAAVAPLVTRYVPAFDLLALPSFPRTETGKIRRAELAAALRRRNGA